MRVDHKSLIGQYYLVINKKILCLLSSFEALILQEAKNNSVESWPK